MLKYGRKSGANALSAYSYTYSYTPLCPCSLRRFRHHLLARDHDLVHVVRAGGAAPGLEGDPVRLRDLRGERYPVGEPFVVHIDVVATVGDVGFDPYPVEDTGPAVAQGMLAGGVYPVQFPS